MFGIGNRLRQKNQKIEEIYHQIAVEIENGKQHKGLWTQALETSEFNEDKARSVYLRLRYQSIIDEGASPQIIGKNERFSQTEKGKGGSRHACCEICGSEIATEGMSPSFFDFLFYSRASRTVFWLLLGYVQFEIVLWLFLAEAPFGIGFLFFPIMPVYHLMTGLGWADDFLLIAIRLVPFSFSLYCYYRASNALKRTHVKLRYQLACQSCAEKSDP